MSSPSSVRRPRSLHRGKDLARRILYPSGSPSQHVMAETSEAAGCLMHPRLFTSWVPVMPPPTFAVADPCRWNPALLPSCSFLSPLSIASCVVAVERTHGKIMVGQEKGVGARAADAAHGHAERHHPGMT